MLDPSGPAITHGHLTSLNNHRHVSDTFGILQHLFKFFPVRLNIKVFRFLTIG